MPFNTIRVLNSYDVLVGKGAISQLPKLISKNYSKIFVVTTPAIEKFHYEKVRAVIDSQVKKIVINVKESTKNIESVKTLWERLFQKGCDRKSLVIILGGGVLGDLAGFAASTFSRGIPYLHIPTTLLSQVDSSVGGKNGINFKGVKNLIGTFDRQVAVICDTDFLETLPDREFIEGFGEIIKHGIVASPDHFEFVTSRKPREFSIEELVKIIFDSIKIKAKIVNSDEKEMGPRKLINFGHTFGHAIEALSLKSKDYLLHGEAVGIGIIVESKISQLLGFISQDKFIKIKNAIKNAGLPTDLPNFSFAELSTKIKSDKKNEKGEIGWTLIDDIGHGVINQKADEKILRSALKDLYASTD